MVGDDGTNNRLCGGLVVGARRAYDTN